MCWIKKKRKEQRSLQSMCKSSLKSSVPWLKRGREARLARKVPMRLTQLLSKFSWSSSVSILIGGAYLHRRLPHQYCRKIGWSFTYFGTEVYCRGFLDLHTLLESSKTKLSNGTRYQFCCWFFLDYFAGNLVLKNVTTDWTSIKNGRKYLKMVIWTVLDSENLIIDRIQWPGLTPSHSTQKVHPLVEP